MSGRDSGDPFLARWAARKTAALKRPRREVESAGENAASPQNTDPPEVPVPEDLKDVDPEKLDPETTDFSRFLREDVPERLQRAALRRLWTSDEALANLDGLNDYDEDFTPAGMAAAAADFFRRTAEVLLEEKPPPGDPEVAENHLSRTIDATDTPGGEEVSQPSTAAPEKPSTDA